MEVVSVFKTQYWSSGSGLQIVTAVESDKDINSLFTIKEGENYPIKINGEPVLCGEVIRLEHITTGKNLHSHEFKSFITNSQEACAFGENGNGMVMSMIILEYLVINKKIMKL